MKLFFTIGWAVALGLMAGAAFEASRTRSDAAAFDRWSGGSTPAVSAAPVDSIDGANVRLAADVEIEGRRFRVYVGRNPDNGAGVNPVWSVVIPADD